MAQIIWSREHPVELLLDLHQILLDVQQDSTGCPLEFCKFASNISELLISSRNAIKISTGCPVKFLLDVYQNLMDVQQNCSTGHPLEQKIWRNVSMNVADWLQSCKKLQMSKSLKHKFGHRVLQLVPYTYVIYYNAVFMITLLCSTYHLYRLYPIQLYYFSSFSGGPFFPSIICF